MGTRTEILGLGLSMVMSASIKLRPAPASQHEAEAMDSCCPQSLREGGDKIWRGVCVDYQGPAKTGTNLDACGRHAK